MSICAFPQVRIYEDFDKMSAKEVYYNEAGNKVTVKLLHFPDVPPEDINKIQFEDEVDGAISRSFAAADCSGCDEDDDEVFLRNGYFRKDFKDDDRPVSTENDYDPENMKDMASFDVEQEADVEEDAAAASAPEAAYFRKPLRKKSSVTQLHARKCSAAFAQAHGIKITPPPKEMPTFQITPQPQSYSSSIDQFRGQGGRPERIIDFCSGGGSLRHQLLGRRSPSPNAANSNLGPGYAQYSKSLLEVPLPRDYGYASSDDLSSEWDSDVSVTSASRVRTHEKKPSGWRKIRNIVQWTPFFQTYKKQRYPWVQLAGHQGNFKAGPEQGTVLKKLCPKEEDCFQVLMKDVLRPYVPEYKGQVTSEDGESVYLQLQDLLSDFYQPCVMDCKIGVRTYLEEELSKAKEKPKLRKDMYEKMIQIDPNAPNEEEHKAKGVTKPRYMVWRETISSTATLGFRIEGIKRSDGTSSKDFKTTKTKEQVKLAFRDFINGSLHALARYIQRLRAIRATLECSDFFRTHEVIGSSLLFVHDRTHASVWLIDFAKTVLLPGNHEIDHSTAWKVGNHEDGYLIGINNLIDLFSELEAEILGDGGGSASNELTPTSSSSSPTSLSPMRCASESHYDEAGAAGGGEDTPTVERVMSQRGGRFPKSQKAEQEAHPEKEEVENMEKSMQCLEENKF